MRPWDDKPAYGPLRQDRRDRSRGGVDVREPVVRQARSSLRGRAARVEVASWSRYGAHRRRCNVACKRGPMNPDVVPAALDELILTVVVDNATDTLSSVDAGIPQLPEVLSLLGRIPPTRRHDGHDAIAVFDHFCVACHGLSVLVRGRRGNESHTMLFDVGPYGDVWIDNAARLDIDLASIEVIVLSHWHWDHSGGLSTVIAAIAAARQAF